MERPSVHGMRRSSLVKNPSDVVGDESDEGRLHLMRVVGNGTATVSPVGRTQERCTIGMVTLEGFTVIQAGVTTRLACTDMGCSSGWCGTGYGCGHGRN